MSEYDDLIDKLGAEPLESTGKPASEEAIAEAKRIAAEATKQRATKAGVPELPEALGDVIDLGDEEPPEEATPAFLVQRNKFGPGAHGVYVSDGTPVGVWLHEQHPDLDGGQVAEMLIYMGLDGELAARYGRNRDLARKAAGQLGEMPAVQNFATAEQEFEERKEAYRDAFVKAQRKKS